MFQFMLKRMAQFSLTLYKNKIAVPTLRNDGSTFI